MLVAGPEGHRPDRHARQAALLENRPRHLFRPDGALKRPGDVVHNPDLARTLERLAAAGPDLFYHGKLAEEIAGDMAENGGLISREDLSHELSVIEPLWGSYRGHRIATTPPPGSGYRCSRCCT